MIEEFDDDDVPDVLDDDGDDDDEESTTRPSPPDRRKSEMVPSTMTPSVKPTKESVMRDRMKFLEQCADDVPKEHDTKELDAIFKKVRRKNAREVGIVDRTPICFQLGYIDYTCARPKQTIPCPPWARGKRILDTLPVIRMFGVTSEGLSVLVRVHGYEPHFFCDCPPGINPDDNGWLMNALYVIDSKAVIAVNREMDNMSRTKFYDREPETKKKNHQFPREFQWPVVTRLELVRRRPVRGYRRNTEMILKVTTRLPRHVPTIRKMIEAGRSFGEDIPPLKTYEADIPFDLRFMVDKNITGCDWVTIESVEDTMERQEISAFQYMDRYHVSEDPIHMGKSMSFREMCEEIVAVAEREEKMRIATARLSGVKLSIQMHTKKFDFGADEISRPKASEDDESRCMIEVDAWHGDVKSLGINGKWAMHAPLRILSVDVECAPLENRFVSAEDGDPAITICSKCNMGKSSEDEDVGVVFQLKSCDKVQAKNSHTVWFDDERSMLMAWRDLVVQYDPDIITGFNTPNFDFPYMFKRAEKLGIYNRFSDMTRIRGEIARRMSNNFSSKAFGTLANDDVRMIGRLLYDVRVIAQRSFKLSSYSLNAVATFAVGMQKTDMDHHELPKLFFEGTSSDRSKIASYCLNDAFLPLAIIRKRLLLINSVEMARATRVPMAYELTRGQQIRILAQLLNVAAAHGYVVDSAAPRDGCRSADDMDGKYTGATVLNPVRGFHPDTVATLDFASLYPSIMLSGNMDYTTILTPAQKAQLHPKNVYTSPIGVSFSQAPRQLDKKLVTSLGLIERTDYYVNPNDTVSVCGGRISTLEIAKKLNLEEGADYKIIQGEDERVIFDTEKEHGLLPLVLISLLARRKIAKQMLEKESDPILRSVYDGRQLALKIVANSTYGFTGTSNGKLPEQRIAASVTSRGRQLIELTRDEVLKKFCKKNGYPSDSKVIYGDTDSVMVKFGPEIPVGEKAARITGNCISDKILSLISGDDFFKTPAGKRAKEEATSAESLATDEDGKKVAREKTMASARSRITEIISSTRETIVNEHVAKKYVPSWKRKTVPEKSSHIDLLQEAYECAKDCAEYISETMRSKMIEVIFLGDSKSGNSAMPTSPEFVRDAVDLSIVTKSAEYGIEACKLVTSLLPRPLSIEFEKVWNSYFLVTKKRYAGVKCIYDPKLKRMVTLPGVSMMGLETVRRDNCALARMSMATALVDMLIKRDLKIMVKHIREAITNILSDDIPMDKFVITKSLSKKKTLFSTKQAHTNLAERMSAHGDSRYSLGDRVRMVYIDRGLKAKRYVTGEDPLCAALHDIPLDKRYYVDKQIKKPLMRLLEHIIPTHPEYAFDEDIVIEDALKGIRTKHKTTDRRAVVRVNHSFVSSDSSSIGKFLVVNAMPCLSCGVAVQTGEEKQKSIAPALCKACEPMKSVAYVIATKKLAEAEKVFYDLQSHCARCTNRILSTNTCANEECPIIYAKIKAKKNLSCAFQTCERFFQW